MGCELGTDLDQIVAIDVSLPDSGRVTLGDTLRPTARALNGRGDSVAADIVWASLDTAIVAVLDSTTGETLGKSVGTGRIQARVGSLRSNPLNVVVLSPPPVAVVRDRREDWHLPERRMGGQILSRGTP